MNNLFQIELLETHWLDIAVEEGDLCAHGRVFLRIGDEVVSEADSGVWTVSATALYLLRSIRMNVKIGMFGNQFLPCCGHFLVVADDKEEVVILGCPSGIDFGVEHSEAVVVLTTEKGSKVAVPVEEYRSQVFAFADKVKSFFDTSRPKAEPEEEHDAKGYSMFWAEWNRLRNQ